MCMWCVCVFIRIYLGSFGSGETSACENYLIRVCVCLFALTCNTWIIVFLCDIHMHEYNIHIYIYIHSYLFWLKRPTVLCAYLSFGVSYHARLVVFTPIARRSSCGPGGFCLRTHHCHGHSRRCWLWCVRSCWSGDYVARVHSIPG